MIKGKCVSYTVVFPLQARTTCHAFAPTNDVLGEVVEILNSMLRTLALEFVREHETAGLAML